MINSTELMYTSRPIAHIALLILADQRKQVVCLCCRGWQVRELEGELEAEQRRHADAQKTVRRHERRIQELTQLSEEEEKARDVERETIEKLQSKMKQYKRDLDDAVSVPSVARKFPTVVYIEIR